MSRVTPLTGCDHRLDDAFRFGGIRLTRLLTDGSHAETRTPQNSSPVTEGTSSLDSAIRQTRSPRRNPLPVIACDRGIGVFVPVYVLETGVLH